MRLDQFRRQAAKKALRPRPFRPTLERLEDKLAPAVFTVTNTNDFGPGSLRQAMMDAESTANANVNTPDEIHFAIDGTGVHTIHPGDKLPYIADPVIIDGYTQFDDANANGVWDIGEDRASPNTLAVGDNAVIKIEIDCSAVHTGPFLFGGDGSTVRGLCINHASDFAFIISAGFDANNTTIAGNFIGTDPTGMIYEAGFGNGIFLGEGGGETIGESVDSPTPADRNVIVAGSSVLGLMITFSAGTKDNTIRGNYFGINAAGTAALNGGNVTQGIYPGAGSQGGTLIEDNVIVANDFAIALDSSNNTIRDNLIGTNAAGTAGLGGGWGVVITEPGPPATNNTIVGNLISGGTIGILFSSTSGGNVVQGNKIGTDITGTSAIPNSGNGIECDSGSGGVTIGGTNPGEGNIIAFNGGNGVAVTNTGADGFAISGNSIFSNGGLGIDLSLHGLEGFVTPNDAGDPDSGPNNFQNFPVLTSAVTGGGQTNFVGTLNSTPNTTFQIEFFAGDAADPTGFGEGQTFLGFSTVTTDANGDVSFSVTLPALVGAGPVVTATATDPAGNTSEFSHVVTAASTDVIIDANTTQAFLDSLTVIHGNLIMVNVAGRTDLRLPNLTRVDGDVIVTGNPDLAVLDAPVLASVGGKVDVSDNPKLTTMNLGSLGSVGGDLSINNDTAATGINVGSLTTVTGNLSINGDTAATGIDVGNLTTVGGSLSISGDTAASGIDVGSLTTVTGSFNISGDTSATGVDVGSLNTVGGSLNVNGDTAATGVDVSSLTTLGGSLNINGDMAATGVDVSSLVTVGGSVSVSNNASLGVANFGGLTGVSGDEVVQIQNSVTSVTANGSTQVNLFTADAQMTAALAKGTFADPVSFTVTRLDPAVLPPEPGQDSAGGAATIDPLAAYRFAFAIPTLGQNATLTFEINVAALSGPDRVAFLDALSLGNATVAVKNDLPGSVFRAFAIAAPGQPPDATHVTVVRLDANHNPLPAGSTATPAFVRFVGLTGHFSEFAVVTVAPSNGAPVVTALAGPTIGVRGQPLHYTGSFSDPDADTWTATVNFGDGSGDHPLSLNPDKTFAFDHVFTSTGSYTVVVTVADNHGGAGTRSLAVSIVVAALESDPLDPAHPMLVVGGTTGNDAIVFSPIGNAGGIRVTINGVAAGDFTPTGRLVAFGQAGDDDIQVAGSVANSAWLYGGGGNDRLKGGAGNDVLLGGDGDDLLVGGDGRDLMIGGRGADRLVGNAGDDILLAGTTAFDANEFALHGIQVEWTSGRSYATRVANIKGIGTGPRDNGSYFLTVDGPSATAFDDAAEDILTGSAGADWFLANLDTGVKDKITDLSASEFADDLDFIGT